MLTVVHILAIKLYITLLENPNYVARSFSHCVTKDVGSSVNMKCLGPVTFPEFCTCI